ncbi:hypothetical protein AEAC466_08845 [Asticcacaulis sp. AC466]|uniref:hypothetical protein n=1 Tax=Asticcacaulis sp. AC466 TaxID=1282362 RepID=UPI0003C3E2FD|nr:hypothetical protein [Asticcacaulis sp. AC466]ESQ84449.1 hypothetical protein AEAC466_08845 [Asticcacaulis sp. AC466]
MKDQKRWIAIGIGATVAIVIGIILAMGMSHGHKDDPKMNDQPTGLTFKVADPTPTLDSKKPLRCYVSGAYVGDVTLAECAKKNGVAAQQLDVGIDDNGNQVAAPTASLVPVPGAPASTPPTAAEPDPAQGAEVVPNTQAAAGPTAACLRYSSNSWNRLADNITIGQCAILLYDGRCVSPGQASYGRWGGKTLRLVPKRVEQSDDNATFRPLVDQGQGCSVPMVR